MFLYKSVVYYKQSVPPHVSANLVAMLSEAHYKGYITEVYEPMAGFNILNVNSIWFKIHIKMWGFKGLVNSLEDLYEVDTEFDV